MNMIACAKMIGITPKLRSLSEECTDVHRHTACCPVCALHTARAPCVCPAREAQHLSYDGYEDYKLHKEDHKTTAGGVHQSAGEFLNHCLREACHDTDKDDEGDTVADALLVNPLAKPHDEH